MRTPYVKHGATLGHVGEPGFCLREAVEGSWVFQCPGTSSEPTWLISIGLQVSDASKRRGSPGAPTDSLSWDIVLREGEGQD